MGLIHDYEVEVSRIWTCPSCGWENRTEIPSIQSELDVPAICEGCCEDFDFADPGSEYE